MYLLTLSAFFRNATKYINVSQKDIYLKFIFISYISNLTNLQRAVANKKCK